jgi:hypothetical protein
MRIEIHDHHTNDKTFYYWELYDGPNDQDEAKGFAVDLIEVFSKIVEWRERIAKDYADNTTNNETLT